MSDFERPEGPADGAPDEVTPRAAEARAESPTEVSTSAEGSGGAAESPDNAVEEPEVAVEEAAVVERSVVGADTPSAVAAAVRELDSLADRDLAEHPDVYQRIHTELQAALTAIDDA